MTDTPPDDRFALPPIEGVWSGRGDEESPDDESDELTPAEPTQSASLRDPVPVLPPPGLFARFAESELATEPASDTEADSEAPYEADGSGFDAEAAFDELEPNADPEADYGWEDEADDAHDPVVMPLAGVADAVDIIEQLEAQSAKAEADSDFDADTDNDGPTGDDLVFADAAEGIAAKDDDDEYDDERNNSDDEVEGAHDEPAAPALPAYAFRRAAADDEAEARRPATGALPMYGRDRTTHDGEERLPHFLLEDEAPLDVVGAQEQLRELAQRNRRKNAAGEHKPSLARTLAEIPILLLVAAVIAFLVKTFLAQAYYIPSGSMLPQLQVDDRVVVSKLAYKLHDPRRGDIVVFDDPQKGVSDQAVVERTGVSKLLRQVGEGVGLVQPSTDEFIKRVIALPGETVSGKNGFVYINDRKLIEPYLPEGLVSSDFAAQKVAAGKLWVMGDNRSGSADSRIFGQIDVDTIVGRAVVKVWPFSSLSFL